jgi:hypothetical protein
VEGNKAHTFRERKAHLEVPVKGAASAVDGVAADLALVLDVEPVQLVEPVGDGLTVITQGEVQGVVDGPIVVVLLVVVVLPGPLLGHLRQGPLLLLP